MHVGVLSAVRTLDAEPVSDQAGPREVARSAIGPWDEKLVHIPWNRER